MIKRIRRWLTELCDTQIHIRVEIESSKTRNRSRAQKQRWARIKITKGQEPQSQQSNAGPGGGGVFPVTNTAAQASPSVVPADSSPEDAAGLAAAVPVTNTAVLGKLTPSAETVLNVEGQPASAVPDPLAVDCPNCGRPGRGLSACEHCGEFIPMTLAVPDSRDFRDYPAKDRPEHDFDAVGRPLKPGT